MKKPKIKTAENEACAPDREIPSGKPGSASRGGLSVTSLALFLVLVSAAAGFYFLTLPAFNLYHSTLEHFDNLIKQDEQQSAALKSLKPKNLPDIYSWSESAFAPQEQMAMVQADLLDKLKNSGLKLVNLNAAAPRPVGPDDLKPLAAVLAKAMPGEKPETIAGELDKAARNTSISGIKITASGSFQSLMKFISMLETDPRLLVLRTLELKQGSSENDLKISLTLRLWLSAPTPGEIARFLVPAPKQNPAVKTRLDAMTPLLSAPVSAGRDSAFEPSATGTAARQPTVDAGIASETQTRPASSSSATARTGSQGASTKPSEAMRPGAEPVIHILGFEPALAAAQATPQTPQPQPPHVAVTGVMRHGDSTQIVVTVGGKSFYPVVGESFGAGYQFIGIQDNQAQIITPQGSVVTIKTP